MNQQAFHAAVSRAETILGADSSPESPLDHYLRLRELAIKPLGCNRVPGCLHTLLAAIQRRLLEPVSAYHEAQLAHMRRFLLDHTRGLTPLSGRAHLLYVAPFDVLSRNGGAARVLGLARALSRQYDVSILSVVGPRRALEVIPVDAGVIIYAVPQTEAFQRAVKKDSGRFGGASFSLGMARYLDLLPILGYWYHRLSRDAAVCVLNQPYLIGLLRQSPGVTEVWYDVPEVNRFFTLRNAGDAADLEGVKVLQAELEAGAVAHANRIGMCSACDVEVLTQEYGDSFRRKVVLVPNGISVNAVPFLPPSQACALKTAVGWARRVVVFLGSAHYPPNLEAVGFLADKLAPPNPEVCFALIGMEAEEIGRTVLPSNVLACGRVSESRKRAILGMADVAISPIRSYDSGSSLKIAEYVAHGKPVLATEHGLRGYEKLAPEVVAVPLDALAVRLTEMLARMEADPEALDDVCKCARQRLRDCYDWEVIAGAYLRGEWH